MEQKFKSLSLFEFQEQFTSSEDFLKYLVEMKWKEGFKCRKCSHNHNCDGKAKHSRQCMSCRYIESPTVESVFTLFIL